MSLSKELKNKITDIIFGWDYKAHKQFYHGGLNSMTPGMVEPQYASYGEESVIGWLLTQLTEDERNELKNFTIADLNNILYRDVKYQMHGIQLNDYIKRNEIKRKGRWSI